ncbi:MAG: sigma 54-interacting transcriptional regulator [Deltaproteobacteria bacterium]|nr:sigma 54-interacting transcriptional regulator [Deltaproteobacteria bacterium]
MSAGELAQFHARRRSDAPRPGLTLLLYLRDGVQAVPLFDGPARIIGRFAPADVTVADASLSRQHAALELRAGALWVEDLQSTNGTWVNGARVQRSRVEPGDELAFGAVVASVHAAGAAELAAQGLDCHDAFMRQLEIEVARAVACERALTLLMLRGDRHLSHWLAVARQQLRPFDRMGIYSGDTLEVLLPELAADAASAVARSIQQAAPALRIGLASLPEHARSTGAICDEARQALQRAGAGQPVQSAGRLTERGALSTAAAPGDQPVARSRQMQEVLETAARYAGAVIPVLILGETGTGKEVVARAIHQGGPRRDRPLIYVNCGAIPAQLVESTLFGHERGAFTGAAQQASGLFEAAHRGSLLLDEVGELPEAAQAALLRVLEIKRFCRVGAHREIEVDVRVLAATHRDLEAMCRAGRFRQDLLYRLNAASLRIPPLRERVDDIAPLARHFLRLASRESQRRVDKIDGRVLTLLEAYPWPGNARELRNAIERAVVIASGDTITVDDLPEALRGLAIGAAPAAVAVGRGDGGAAGDGVAAGDGGPVDAADINLRAELDRLERELIARMLRACDWDRSRAATRLGLPLRTLARKIAALGIERE